MCIVFPSTFIAQDDTKRYTCEVRATSFVSGILRTKFPTDQPFISHEWQNSQLQVTKRKNNMSLLEKDTFLSCAKKNI